MKAAKTGSMTVLEHVHALQRVGRPRNFSLDLNSTASVRSDEPCEPRSDGMSHATISRTGQVAGQTGAVGLDTSQEVRRVLYDGDGGAALAVARSLGLEGPLQMVGELVLLALDHNASEAAEFAAQCSGALRIRGCDGDEELADAIDAARGIASSEATPLEQLAVDLEQLADLIDGGPDSAGGRLDLMNGELWPEFVFEDSFDDGEDAADRGLHVWPTGSRRAYDDMVDFTATRPDQRLRERLDRALDGRGAFRRFKDVVFAWPGDREDWLVFAEDHRRGRAREWLADAG